MALTERISACWIYGVALIWPALISSTCTAQPVITVAPSQILDLRGLLRAHTLRQDFAFGGIAENSGRWAAYADFPSTTTSMVIMGKDNAPPEFSDFIKGVVDRIAMGPSGQIYLRMKYTSGGGDIEILNGDLKLMGHQRYKKTSLEPISSPAGVFWADGLPVKSISRVGLGFIRSASAFEDGNQQPFDSYTPDYGTIAALPNGTSAPRWIRVKEVAEEVDVFENNGSLVAKNTIDLDSAYTAIGYPIAQHYPAVEAERIGWMAVSPEGELYVRLGSVPIFKPTPLAVIDPLSGQLLRVVSVVLPRSAERIDQYNPLGYMDDSRAAMGDRLAILDVHVGILAVYFKY